MHLYFEATILASVFGLFVFFFVNGQLNTETDWILLWFWNLQNMNILIIFPMYPRNLVKLKLIDNAEILVI